MEIIGFAVTVLGFVFAIWQYMRAEKAISEQKKSEYKLYQTIDSMPEKVVQGIANILPPPTPEETLSNVSSEQELQADLGDYGTPHIISYADVDGDGNNELLIQYPFGVHGSELRVLSWKNFKFVQIARLGSDTPTYFWVEDFDSDGTLEILTIETDSKHDLPYVYGLREKVVYKWNGKKFVVIHIEPEYTQEFLEEALNEFKEEYEQQY